MALKPAESYTRTLQSLYSDCGAAVPRRKIFLRSCKKFSTVAKVFLGYDKFSNNKLSCNKFSRDKLFDNKFSRGKFFVPSLISLFAFLSLSLLIIFPSRSEIVAVSYIRNYIQNNWNVSLPAPTGTIASTKYLFSAIDATNQSLNGVATSYSSSAAGGIVGRTLADRELSSKIKYCAPGTYLAAGNNDCQNCGAGYYCEGGAHRQECVYKIATCPEINHSAENIPSSWNGIFNKPLTLAEVNSMGIQATDISQWRNLGCSRYNEHGADFDDHAAIDAATGGIKGTIGPGVYLFTESNNHSECPTSCYNSNIAVFDRPAGYKSVHSTTGVSTVPYHIFVDTNNAVYSSYTIRFPVSFWGYYVKETNISGIESAPFVAWDNNPELCVWELI
jgi:hypothetical protein